MTATARQVSVSADRIVDTALEIVDLWLTTPFAGGRHEKRIRMIDEQP